ncbi:MAG: helix-turn-helix transcriptional regulator [Oscillospiraceae bacterium]|nr:helix-turn-helix transcriptional regulator [Oscillospiraceae bacterium]
MVNYEKFTAEVAKRLREQRWTRQKLADATVNLKSGNPYSVDTVNSFMQGKRISDDVANAIAKALDIPEHMAS